MSRTVGIVALLLLLTAGCSDEPKPKPTYLPTRIVSAIEADDAVALSAWLESGADPDLRDQAEENTALWFAVLHRADTCLLVLLEAGADPSMTSKEGLPPLAMAVSGGYRSGLELLLEHGADPNQVVNGQASVVGMAAMMGDAETLELMLEHGGDPLKPGGVGGHALAAAAGMGSMRDEDCSKLRVILKHIGPDGDVDAPSSFGMTALISAAMFGSVEAVELLLEAGADPNKLGMGGATALGSATVMARTEIGSLLVERGANVNVRGAGAITPLHHAARDARVGYLQQLIKAGADLDAKDSKGNTPLHLAASGTDAKASSGETKASEADRKKAVTLLLDAGADCKIINAEGKTPAEVARSADLRELIETPPKD